MDFTSYPQDGGRAEGVRGAGRTARDARRMDSEPLTIECPRCGATADERYYGPCTSCRETMRATLGGAAREVEAATYEPKMNVTPNAVALKDD